MQLGMMNDPRLNACDEARWAAAHGFDFLDLTVEGPHAALEQIDLPQLRTILTDAGMGIIGHTAWYLPFVTPQKRVRDAAAECVVESFPLFAELGATWVNVHLATGARLFPLSQRLQWQAECFAELAERAAPFGLRIMVEHPPDPLIGASEIGVVIADPRLGFHLDVGHAHVAGNRLDSLLKHFGPRLAHVHLSDNTGRSDDHLPLGAGTIGWPETIKKLKQVGYDHTITLEVFSADRDYLLLGARKVREWWK